MTTTAAETKVSRFGQYSGFTTTAYDGWTRKSQYIETRDGTRLAADVFIPTRDGVEATEPLPVVWTHHRYRRAFRDPATAAAMGLPEDALIPVLYHVPGLTTLLEHGYVVAAVDVRGTGASFGTWRGLFTTEETADAFDATEWLAAQPFCDGNVGMFGPAYLGITQYMTAGAAPPSLKAIFPEVSVFDLYGLFYPGGVFHDDLLRIWGTVTRQLDELTVTEPVDDDPEGTLRDEAAATRAQNADVFALYEGLPHRDSAVGDELPYRDWSPDGGIEGMRRSGVACYHWAGWFDSFPKDALLAYRNHTGPQKLAMGPWSHRTHGAELSHGLVVVERLRWFDRWLKGVENGVDEEPPLNLFTLEGADGGEWRTADAWPLPDAAAVDLYLHAGPSGTAASANDGRLSPEMPAVAGERDAFVVDYTATSGESTRWRDTVGGAFEYGDMAANDAKGLTWTSEPLAASLEVTGHPVVRLWVTASAPDADVFAYLEEVDADGTSRYVSEGTLRASNRAVGEAPYDYLGLPYHRGFQADRGDLPAGEPVELAFDLLPVSRVFAAGSRVRLTVTGADKDNAATPQQDPAPELGVHRDLAYPSRLMLPVVPRGGANPLPGWDARG